MSDIGGSVPNYFYYDGDQKRIITEDSQGRTYFLYDGGKVAVEKNASGTTQGAYMNQGPSIYDPLIYMDRAGTKSYHLFNHLGTTLALASAAQALSDTYRWNAWGVELASAGSTSNHFAFVGELGYYADPDVSSLHVGARRYAPALGRFATRDLLMSASRYSYVANAAPQLVDVDGNLRGWPRGGMWQQIGRRLEAEYRGLFGPLGQFLHWGPQQPPSKLERCIKKCLAEAFPGIVGGETVLQLVKKSTKWGAKAYKFASIAGWIATGIQFAVCMDRCMNPDRKPCPPLGPVSPVPHLPQAGYGFEEDALGRRLYY